MSIDIPRVDFVCESSWCYKVETWPGSKNAASDLLLDIEIDTVSRYSVVYCVCRYGLDIDQLFTLSSMLDVIVSRMGLCNSPFS